MLLGSVGVGGKRKRERQRDRRAKLEKLFIFAALRDGGKLCSQWVGDETKRSCVLYIHQDRRMETIRVIGSSLAAAARSTWLQ